MPPEYFCVMVSILFFFLRHFNRQRCVTNIAPSVYFLLTFSSITLFKVSKASSFNFYLVETCPFKDIILRSYFAFLIFILSFFNRLCKCCNYIVQCFRYGIKAGFFAALGVFSNENDTASFKASASFSEIRFSFVTVFPKESVITLSSFKSE